MQTSDGLVQFDLRGETTTSHAVDALLAETLAEELVRKHHLAIENESYVFTEDFLRDLVSTYRAKFGLPEMPTLIAVRIWVASQREVRALKKNTSEPPGSQNPTESTPSEGS